MKFGTRVTGVQRLFRGELYLEAGGIPVDQIDKQGRNKGKFQDVKQHDLFSTSEAPWIQHPNQ